MMLLFLQKNNLIENVLGTWNRDLAKILNKGPIYRLEQNDGIESLDKYMP